ncbi:MAG: PaaI family thioesterase [Pseudomonadales bacterium]|nr:PaaI family thioesterase [Pseudomonadales bacterium]
MKLLSELHDAGEGKNLSLLLSKIPYTKFLGINVRTAGSLLITELKFQEKLIGNPVLPAIHGGVLGAFLEVTAVLQILYDSSSQSLPKTIDISIDYLRSARPVDLFGRAIVARQGRRVANVRCEIWQDDVNRPIALSHGHFLLKEDA